METQEYNEMKKLRSSLESRLDKLSEEFHQNWEKVELGLFSESEVQDKNCILQARITELAKVIQKIDNIIFEDDMKDEEYYPGIKE